MEKCKTREGVCAVRAGEEIFIGSGKRREAWLDVFNTLGRDEGEARIAVERLKKDLPGYEERFPVVRYAKVKVEEI